MRTVFLVAGVMLTIVTLLALSTWSMVRKVLEPLRQAVAVADRVAQGNRAAVDVDLALVDTEFVG